MSLLKQSTAVTIKLGPFVDSTDGVTPKTGLTISQADIRLSKNGGAFAQTNNVAGATHDENGWYGIPIDTTDTNTLGRLQVAVYEAGALPCFAEFMVVPANTYDSLISGSDVLTADVTQVGGDAQSAVDLKDFADAGYDPATNKVQGVVLTDTCTTNTDMRGTNNAALASVCTEARLAELDAANLITDVANVKTDTAAILVDTGTTLETHITDIKGTGFVKDTHSLPQCLTANVSALAIEANVQGYAAAALAAYDPPTNAEMVARSLLAADYFDPAVDTVTVGTNSDKTGYSISGVKTTLDALNDISAANVNTEVSDVIKTDTIAEMAQGAPPASPTIEQILNYLYRMWRNKIETTSALISLYDDAGTTVLAKSTISDDTVTFSKGEYVTGA